MLSQYHIEIMLTSLGERFSPRSMSVMIHANLNQDRLSGQFGHDEYHFDNNAFDKSYAYIEENRALTRASLQRNDARAAWVAFGRMLHTAQDFYAHSNYITLWLSLFNGRALPAPPEVDPVHPSLLESPDLRSGKVYYPFELLYFIKRLRPYVLPFLPRDSHAWMNLDSPDQGFKFEYAMQAAIKRTVIEFEKTTLDFSDEMCRLFLDG
jgi:hypothetical protein